MDTSISTPTAGSVAIVPTQSEMASGAADGRVAHRHLGAAAGSFAGHGGLCRVRIRVRPDPG